MKKYPKMLSWELLKRVCLNTGYHREHSSCSVRFDPHRTHLPLVSQGRTYITRSSSKTLWVPLQNHVVEQTLVVRLIVGGAHVLQSMCSQGWGCSPNHVPVGSGSHLLQTLFSKVICLENIPHLMSAWFGEGSPHPCGNPEAYAGQPAVSNQVRLSCETSHNCSCHCLLARSPGPPPKLSGGLVLSTATHLSNDFGGGQRRLCANLFACLLRVCFHFDSVQDITGEKEEPSAALDPELEKLRKELVSLSKALYGNSGRSKHLEPFPVLQVCWDDSGMNCCFVRRTC